MNVLKVPGTNEEIICLTVSCASPKRFLTMSWVDRLLLSATRNKKHRTLSHISWSRAKNVPILKIQLCKFVSNGQANERVQKLKISIYCVCLFVRVENGTHSNCIRTESIVSRMAM